jgi:hypothetical protein
MNILSNVIYFAVVAGFTHWYLRWIGRQTEGWSLTNMQKRIVRLLMAGLGAVTVVGLIAALCLWQWTTLIMTFLAALHYLRSVDQWSTQKLAKVTNLA